MAYADSDNIEVMTLGVKNGLETEDYEALVTLAVTHGDNKVDNKLKKDNIPLPSAPGEGGSYDSRIIDAASLYAAAFVLDTYTEDDNQSATAKSYIADGDTFIQGYIDDYLSDNKDNDESIPIITAYSSNRTTW